MNEERGYYRVMVTWNGEVQLVQCVPARSSVVVEAPYGGAGVTVDYVPELEP